MLHSIGLTDPAFNYAPFAPYPNTSTLSSNTISQPDTNPNPMLSALPRSTHGLSSATTVAMAAAAAAASAGISPSIKDSRWLTLEVCRQYQRKQCSRDESECKFAHPPTHVDVQSGRVVCCYDSIKGKCQRRDPPCKYLHPPQHLKEQLIQNGRNNMIMRNMQFQLLTQQYLVQGGLVPLTAAAVAAANAGNPNGPNTNPGPTGTTSNSLLYGTPLTLGGPGAPSPYQVLNPDFMTSNNSCATETPISELFISSSNGPSPNPINVPSSTCLSDLYWQSIQQLIKLKMRIQLDQVTKQSKPLAIFAAHPTNDSPIRDTNSVMDASFTGFSRKRSYTVMETARTESGLGSTPSLIPELLLVSQLNKYATMGFSPYLNGLSTSGLASFHGITGPPTLNESNGHLPMRSTLSDMKNGMNLYSPTAAATLAHLNGISAGKQDNGDNLNGCVMLMNGPSLDSMKPKEMNGVSHTNGSSMPMNSISNGHSGTNGTSQTSQPNSTNLNGHANNNNNNLAVVASLISWQQNGAPLAIPHPNSLTPDSLAAAVAAVTGGAAANGTVGPTGDLAQHYPGLPDHPAYFQPAYHIEIPPFPFH